MKVWLLCLLAFVAVLARAQDLQYEQAAYTDNAAPAPFEQEQQVVEADAAPEMTSVAQEEEEEGESFAEMDAAPGKLSKQAHKLQRKIAAAAASVKKNAKRGGNVSPSKKKPAPAPKPKAKKPVAKPVSKKRAQALKKKLLRPIVAPKKLSGKGKGKPSRRPASRPSRRPAPRPSRRPAGRKPRRPLRIPRPPAAARGGSDDIFHEERLEPADPAARDPEMQKLNLALEAVKEDILSTNKQINDERRWVIAVSKIISSYNTKMKRVEAHIIALRKEMKALYRKKKQIENLKLQRALEAKLKEAKAELATLTNSLKHVAKKQGELNKSGRDLRLTIAGIQGQLAKLRGQRMFKKCKAGTKFSKKAKKCVSVCKPGQAFNKKSKKCVSRCKKGSKWNKKARRCVKGKGKARK